MPGTFETITLFVFGTVTIVTLLLYVLEYRKHQHDLRELLKPSLNETQEQSQQIVEDAVKKAQDLITTAELESIKTIADSRQSSKLLKEEYEKQVGKFAAEAAETFKNELVQVENIFKNEIMKSYDEFQEHLSNLKFHTEKTENLATQAVQQRINELIERFEQNLTDFFTQTQQKSISSLELELKSARELIDTYKQKQLMLIDENIIAILERTLSLVLSKRLTLKDHLDEINESLEQAKVEKFIA